MKKWMYHKDHEYRGSESGKKFRMITQLYQTGVYTIVNNSPVFQACMSPGQLVRIEKNLRKMEGLGDIKDLKFGPSITVKKVNGFYKEAK